MGLKTASQACWVSLRQGGSREDPEEEEQVMPSGQHGALVLPGNDMICDAKFEDEDDLEISDLSR